MGLGMEADFAELAVVMIQGELATERGPKA